MATMSSSQLARDHALNDVDVTQASKGVWLVKVPKYLSERWQNSLKSEDTAAGGGVVGKLEVIAPPPATSASAQPPKSEVRFTLSEKLRKTSDSDELLPAEHKFVITSMPSQQHNVFCEEESMDRTTLEKTTQHKVVGKIVTRAECRPIASDGYMKLKRKHIETKNCPSAQMIQLTEVVNNFKPVASHVFHKQKRKDLQEQGQRCVLDKSVVMNLLFKAFEKHQYYTFHDLVNITEQPVTHLKNILNEIAVYNTKYPHKYMWQLKSEYRHYEGSSGEADEQQQQQQGDEANNTSSSTN